MPYLKPLEFQTAFTRRIGKRIALAFEGELFAVIHLMIAGRLQWRQAGASLTRSLGVDLDRLEVPRPVLEPPGRDEPAVGRVAPGTGKG